MERPTSRNLIAFYSRCIALGLIIAMVVHYFFEGNELIIDGLLVIIFLLISFLAAKRPTQQENAT